MIRSLSLVSIFCIFAGSVSVIAQEQRTAGSGMEQRGPARRALEINISARALDDGHSIIWEQNEKRITIPGSPVSIKLVGSNLVVAAQFTPFIRRQGNVLVAQGQIWIANPDSGVSYYTSIQTIPMDYSEPIYFFPLGTSDSSIEIIITVNPFAEADISEVSANAGNEN